MRRLEEYIVKGGRKLRLGYTTGTCAAAATAAAATLLLTGEALKAVSITTPKGLKVLLEIEYSRLESGRAVCAVRKDAGDDPDSTDGAIVRAVVRKIGGGFEVSGGEGVGRVTLPGLARPVGEPAINPVPLVMIREQLEAATQKAGYSGGLAVEISVPGGETLAKSTYNPRLGIVGGISILGPSGIVEPMSEAALIDTIKAEIDQRAALGAKVLLIVPGNYGADSAKSEFGIDINLGVKCSNYIGEALDYAVYREFEHIALLGHAGKLLKLAAGIMNTHSSVADGRAEIITTHAALCGATAKQARRLMEAVTVDAADSMLVEFGMETQVWGSITDKVRQHLDYRLKNRAEIVFAAFCGRGIVMRSEKLENLITQINNT